MKKNSPGIQALVLCSILALSHVSKAQNDTISAIAPVGPEAFEVMNEFFHYDKDIPLEAAIVMRQDEPQYIREKLVFSGLRNNRVPGYFAIPKTGNAPYPCILLLHGIASSKESWWTDDSFNFGGRLTEQLLHSGFAVLSLDAEYHGERLLNNDFESPDVFTFEKGWLQRARDMIVQSSIEYSRALDYLAVRSEIDMSRIGMVGYSMGGMMTFMLTATDPRIKAAVACVSPILKEPYSAIAIQNYAPYIKNQPFLMLMGAGDIRNYSKQDARVLFDFLQTPAKELIFFESGHKLPVEWTDKATDWMKTKLE